MKKVLLVLSAVVVIAAVTIFTSKPGLFQGFIGKDSVDFCESFEDAADKYIYLSSTGELTTDYLSSVEQTLDEGQKYECDKDIYYKLEYAYLHIGDDASSGESEPDMDLCLLTSTNLPGIEVGFDNAENTPAYELSSASRFVDSDFNWNERELSTWYDDGLPLISFPPPYCRNDEITILFVKTNTAAYPDLFDPTSITPDQFSFSDPCAVGEPNVLLEVPEESTEVRYTSGSDIAWLSLDASEYLILHMNNSDLCEYNPSPYW